MKWWECVFWRDAYPIMFGCGSPCPNCNPISQLFILSFYPSLSYALHFRPFFALQTSSLVYIFWFGSPNQLGTLLLTTSNSICFPLPPCISLSLGPPSFGFGRWGWVTDHHGLSPYGWWRPKKQNPPYAHIINLWSQFHIIIDKNKIIWILFN